MENHLKIKIDEAMTRPFVGSYIFTNEELSIIYDDVSKMFRSIITERGETISTLYYDEIFVALVNLAKEWTYEEDAFFDFVYRRLLGSAKGNAKAYNQIVDVIQHLYKKNKIFVFKSFIKKYYTTLCSHAFAPISSMHAFFDMCWEIYCNDLNQQYIKNDSNFEIIADSLKNKFSESKNEDDYFQLGSRSYALRAGIRGLALDEKERLIGLLDATISTIHSLFNNEVIECNDYLKTIIKSWWTKKELEFGTSRVKTVYRKEVIINDYSQIKPKYIMTNDAVKLYIPPIRLNGNFDYEPYLEIQVAGQSVKCEPLNLCGSGILMATRSYEIDISELSSLDINLQITHCDKIIYNSKNSLQREFLLFNSSGKEITSIECIPNIYFLYITNFNNLSQYPKDIERININNTYSLNAMDGDIIQTKNKAIFFLNEKSNKDISFSANRLSYVSYRSNNEEFCVIDGELYVELINDSISHEYGVKYEDSVFKLIEFDKIQVRERVRYCISSLLLVGETQHISIFKYSDNSIVANINLIKFNNINIRFEKDVYYGDAETSFVEFKTDKYHIRQTFLVGEDEVFIHINDGYIIANPPLLKWKIDDGEWHTNYIEKPIWYKDITNSSVLYIEIPKDKTIEIGLNNYFVEKVSNRLCFKIGEMIYRLKDTSNETVYTAFAKLENTNLYPLLKVYTKETFVSNPFEIDELSHKLIWNPAFYVGDRDSKFKLILENESKVITELDVNLENRVFDLIDAPEGYYNLMINLVKKSFFAKEVKLLESDIILGNEKNFKYKGKFFAINNVMLFGKAQSEKILPIYIENINYLGNIDGCDYYSGFLYAKNKEGKKIYLSKMTKDDGSVVQINPVRIEHKTNTTCYLGFGLDIYDMKTFDYNGEFTLNRNRVSIDWHTNGIKNKSIDYFEYEVKNV